MSKRALEILGTNLFLLSGKNFSEAIRKSIDSTSTLDLSKTFRRKLLNFEVHFISKKAINQFYDEAIKHYDLLTDTSQYIKDINWFWESLISLHPEYLLHEDKLYLIDMPTLHSITGVSDYNAIMAYIKQEYSGEHVLTDESYKKIKKATGNGFASATNALKKVLSTCTDKDSLWKYLKGIDAGHLGANITHLTASFTIGALLAAGPESAKSLMEAVKDPSTKQIVENQFRDILNRKEFKGTFKQELFNTLYDHEVELIREVGSGKAYASLELAFKADETKIKDIVKKLKIYLKNSGVEIGPQDSKINRDFGGEIESMVRSYLPRFYIAIEEALHVQVSKGVINLATLQGSDNLVTILEKKLKNVLVKGTNTPNKLISSTKYNSNKKQSNIPVKVAKNKPKVTIIKRDTKNPIKLPTLRNIQGQFTSVTKLESLIRAQLRPTIVKNMHRPNLNYQTGRFADSVKLESISRARDGALSAFLSYMRYPYATFERDGKQGKKGYYPSRLIEGSVREIASKLVRDRMRVVIQ